MSDEVALESEENFLIEAVVHECTELALKIINLRFEIFEVIVELSLKSHFRARPRPCNIKLTSK